MDSQPDILNSPTDSLLTWIRQLIYHELPQSKQGQAFAKQLDQFVTLAFEPEAKINPFISLPELCCLASNGSPKLCRPIVAAWVLLLLAAKLIDDVEDQAIQDDVPLIVNATTGLHFVIQLILSKLIQAPETAASFLPILLKLDRTMLHACAGQHGDLSNYWQQQEEIDPETWLEIARAKSGDFFAWAAWAGARVTDASDDTLAACWTFGHHLGTLLQIADDFNDVWLSPQPGDLVTGCLSLPVIYARFVSDKATRNHLDQLLAQAQSGKRDAEEKIRQILIEIGAQNYLLVVARMEYFQAVAALEQIDPTPEFRQALSALLDEILPAVNSNFLR